MPTRRRPRLRVLIGVLAGVLVLCGGGVAVATWTLVRATDTVGEVDFVRPLAVPPLADSRLDDQGRRVFDLIAREGRRDFRGDGRLTRTAGFDGDFLGPTLRAKRGEQVRVNVVNKLGEETNVHWHGMHLPARMDGGPHQLVRPGATWSPTWRVDQPAATLWYHPHPHGATEEQVYRGLAGMFILDDDREAALPLPRTYGVDDVPVIVQDRSFSRSGQFSKTRNSIASIGVLGDTLLVNGTVGPYLDVRTERVRLRLLNASTARTYNFGLSDDRPFALIGTDGGLLARTARLTRIRLSPGERAEIVVDVRPGERVTLRSTPPDLGIGGLSRRSAGGADRLDVLQLRAASTLTPAPPVPDTLVPVDRLDPSAAATTRTLEFQGRGINGRSMRMDRIDFAATRDTTEVWEVLNSDGTPHNFHVHDVQFQLLSVDGAAPPPELGGWKDTIYLPPHRPMRIVLRFTDHSDPNLPYMYHCHLLWHEDSGMMGQFVVVEPGQAPGRPPTHAGHGEHN
ncbi:multicopper oxidase family protein [Micromonospora cremea]|uniref:Multicopper oxidase with three cupredoxin domains (Includes cell division protein FtsP and spore coat protein CotA) n=1 Tax=Micromonospora cremea TaxID=709881 RepID=A0A1N5UV42_9ACTN|nr:multicopper oxidase domain-containing protein [Micromonospora cremea]SIM64602.1 Multicopper oxidase with three cupredoxin domains (includes cell division protein FtsP and spore coat protein CotA) [Micromonospora cremea]